MSSPAEPLIVFVHLQRTGGSTLDRMLRRQLGDRYARLGTFKDYEATMRRVQEVGRDPGALRAVRGHMTAGVRQWLPADTRFVTFLRTPVDRVVSHYHHLHERKVPARPFGVPPMPESMTLDECVADGRYVLDNLMTRMLSDEPSPLGNVDAARLEDAKRNVRELFTVVGLSERYDESLMLAQLRLGLPRATYRRVGESRGGPAETLSEETLALIRSRNEFDQELYSVATAVFDEHLAAVADDEEFARDLEALRVSHRLLAEEGAPSNVDPVAEARAELLVLDLRLSERIAESERALAAQIRKRQRLERRVARLKSKNKILAAQFRRSFVRRVLARSRRALRWW